MAAYYNEIDPYAAQWLRNLIAAGHIAAGDVDERSIEDVCPDDLKNYTQCHFFAGIGGWSLALRLAGWPDDRPAWTGSCPCQPFSSAGKGEGFSDERHLWPSWYHLIGACQPPVIFGEQVAAAVGHGWLDLVYEDLEAKGYEVGSIVLPASGVGAPHKRDRLWFVADSAGARLEGRVRQCLQRDSNGSPIFGQDSYVADTQCFGQQGQREFAEPSCAATDCARKANRADHAGAGHWEGGVYINCQDGKARLIEPSIPLLAHGIPSRVGRLRAYGNAIVPPLAAEFIKASMECLL